MELYNGIYRWEGTKTGDREPIAWSPGAYDVKLYRRSNSSQKVELFKPYVCVYSGTGEGQSISADPTKFAKQLCFEFSLDIERVFWVEDLLTEEERFEVILFSRTARVGDNTFYSTEKRKALPLEAAQLEEELACFSQS